MAGKFSEVFSLDASAGASYWFFDLMAEDMRRAFTGARI